MGNIHTIRTDREPVKGDILLRHIWKNQPNECISWWRYNETIDIENVKQYTTLNGSFRDMYQSFEVRNLYITINGSFSRDEYVTDGTEVIKATSKLVNEQGFSDRRDWKKIVLTTDPDLIAERVKSAGDEFLDWFVKNPTCETVVVRQRPKVSAIVKGKGIGYFANGYDIIIPKKLEQIDQDNPVTRGSTALVYKQEPQFGTKEFNDLASAYFGGKPKQYSKYLSCCRSKEECYCKEEPKQETLEESNQTTAIRFLEWYRRRGIIYQFHSYHIPMDDRKYLNALQLFEIFKKELYE